MRKILLFISILLTSTLAISCGGNQASGGDKVIKTTKAGDVTVALMSDTGDLKNGENDLLLTFADASGNPVDVGAASLTFHMPAMGAMAEMNNRSTLTTTDAPGKYRAQVNIEMPGTWEARIAYEGPRGKGQTTMSVQAK
jgi:hypothetical protein